MAKEASQPGFSHLGPRGEARMVDVSDKEPTRREAAASAVLRSTVQVLDRLMSGSLPKGDALSTARVAGITAAKRTSEWIPLCHLLPLDWVQVEFERTAPTELRITCTARTIARSGVEMEALVGAAAAALTLYDMAKSVDRAMVIGPIQLESKSGGRSGEFHRTQGSA